MSARAGTPLAEVEAALDANGQMLPFEPCDMTGLYGSQGAPTIGAVVACNASGPRRVSHGAARDSLIGVRFVNGLGEAIKSGGRVMKNVTGLDLVKLSCGAHGTLGALTEVTFKVLPRPPAQRTLAIEGLDDRAAIGAFSKALCSPYEVSGAAHLPSGIGARRARTLLRIENFAESVTYRGAALRDLLGAGEAVEDEASRSLWREIGRAAFFAHPDPSALWRVSVAPSRAADFVARVGRERAIRHFLDWGGGLVWIATEDRGDAGAGALRAATIALGGHATLVRASAETRARVDVFEPLSEPLMRLTRGVKAAFDPQGLLNPGRMYPGV